MCNNFENAYINGKLIKLKLKEEKKKNTDSQKLRGGKRFKK